MARNSSRGDDFSQFGNLGWSKVGQRSFVDSLEADVGHAGTRVQAAVCKLRDNFLASRSSAAREKD